MPWTGCACCARNICNGLDGKEVMLAHCGGKQARDQKAARGLTISMWCRFSPHRRWRYTFNSVPYFFASLQARIEMTQTNTEAIDYPYPTTDTPSLTIHHAIIVCEAVHCACPWDDERDAKEDDNLV